MSEAENYLELNRELWNERTRHHLHSAFYDLPGFLAGKSSLNAIELAALGDVRGKSVLHLQCHFGQDTLSLARMGASACGIDLSDNAIAEAKKLAAQLQLDASFVCCNVYDVPDHVTQQFDIVFSSYGTIGWLPDLDRWAEVIAAKLKPGGMFVFAEFHPVVWMFDEQFEKVAYPYLNVAPIIEKEKGTYTDREAPIEQTSVSWNHGLGEVITALSRHGLRVDLLEEYDYSPYNCFRRMVKTEKGWQIEGLEGKLPLVYCLRASK